MRIDGPRRPTRAQALLGVGSAVCYAVGYPLALVADLSWGWLLVMLGGLLLIGLGAVTVARIHRGSSAK